MFVSYYMDSTRVKSDRVLKNKKYRYYITITFNFKNVVSKSI
jgi:hypothetical protein